MDFNDFVAEYSEKFGVPDEEWDGLRKSVVLTFMGEEGDRVVARYKGVPVFRHKDSEKVISAGDTWICSLDKSQSTYYFAKGIQRIDSSFMYELMRGQIDEIASVIWKDQRHVIEPLLEKEYCKVMEEHVRQTVSDVKAEYEEQIKFLKENIHQLEQKEAEDKKIIESLQEKKEVTHYIDQGNVEVATQRGKSERALFPKNVQIVREGPDKISSPAFDRSRYFVHLSTDHRLMTIRPHESGSVVCINNSMLLDGLGIVSPFESEYNMISEYNQQTGNMKVYL